MPLGQQERGIFEEQATPLYEEIVTSGGIAGTDKRIAKRGELHQAFELLVEVGLVVRSDDGASWRAVDPAAVQAQVVAPLGQQGAELIAESAHWAQAFSTLSHAWRRSPSAVGGPFAEIRGLATIGNFLASLVSDAEIELLTAQPQDRRGVKQLGGEVGARDIAALKRGVKMRTLYQHAARRGADTRKYVAAVTAAGAEVRTLDEFFNRLIVVDRRIAIIPSHEGCQHRHGDQRAARWWATWSTCSSGTGSGPGPFTSSETSLMRDIAAEQRAMTIRMLLEGRADPAGAKRLGVSPRTYAGYVADLKNEFEVETRFQLGYEMGKRGISGREMDEPTP